MGTSILPFAQDTNKDGSPISVGSLLNAGRGGLSNVHINAGGIY